MIGLSRERVVFPGFAAGFAGGFTAAGGAAAGFAGGFTAAGGAAAGFAGGFAAGGAAAGGAAAGFAGADAAGFAAGFGAVVPVAAPVVAPSLAPILAASFNPDLEPGLPDAVELEAPTTGFAFPGSRNAGLLAGAGSPKHFCNYQSVNDRTVGDGYMHELALNSSNGFLKIGIAVVLSKRPGTAPSTPALAEISELTSTHPEKLPEALGLTPVPALAAAAALMPIVTVPLMSRSTKTLALEKPLSKFTPRASRGMIWPSRLPPTSA